MEGDQVEEEGVCHIFDKDAPEGEHEEKSHVDVKEIVGRHHVGGVDHGEKFFDVPYEV